MTTKFQSLEEINAAKTALILIAAAFAFSCFAWWEQDDFYIHLQYVRNLVERGEWSFTPGTPSYGTTSPLWILAVAAPGLLGVPLPLAAKILSVGFAVGCILLLLRARDLFRHPAIHSAAIVAIFADHWLRLAAGSGMEATMTAFLALALGLSIIRNPAPTNLQLAGYGAVSGLLILSRPEFFVIPAILVFVPRRRSLAGWLTGCIVLALALVLVLVPWFWYALTHFGSITPNTVALKVASGHVPLIPKLAGIINAVRREASFFGPMYFPELLAIAAALVFMLRRKLPAGRNAPLAVWGLTFFLPALYILIQARGGEAITYRYGAPVLPLLVLLGFMLLDAMLANRRRAVVLRIAAVAALWTLGIGTALSIAHTPSLRKSHDYLTNVLVRYGTWLNQNTPPGARVGCYDVGAIAYHSRRPILDLVGLNNPEVIPLIDPNERPRVNTAAIMKFKPDYLVSFLADYGGLYARVPIAETLLTATAEPYRFGSKPTGKTYTCSLWRLDWSKAKPE